MQHGNGRSFFRVPAGSKSRLPKRLVNPRLVCPPRPPVAGACRSGGGYGCRASGAGCRGQLSIRQRVKGVRPSALWASRAWSSVPAFRHGTSPFPVHSPLFTIWATIRTAQDMIK
ncbi:hypothetical protein [Azospirillum largimobile]